MEKNFDLFLFKQQEREQEQLPIFQDYAIDFETGEPLVENGDVVIWEKNDALRVWIYRVLKTQWKKYPIHSESYGNELQEHIGTIYDESIKKVIIEQQIKDCLLVNPYLLSAYGFEFTNTDEGLQVRFTVDTIYGRLEEEVRGFGI